MPSTTSRVRARPLLALACTLIATAAFAVAGGFRAVPLWTTAGQNVHNTRFQERDSRIKRGNLDRLEVAWVFEAAERISATATVDRHHVYFPDWDQWVYKLRRSDGGLVWRASIGQYTGLPGDFTRNSPTLWRDLVIVGDMGGLAGVGAKVLALDRATGELVWMTQVDDHIAAIVTLSPVVHDGVVFVGISSNEPFFSTFPGYPCCSFRGSVVALDAATGAILWRTFFTPEPPPDHDFDVDGSWYSGTALWGGSMAVDAERRLLYAGTGQNYMLPPDVLACIDEANQSGGDPRLCNHPENRFDSVVALDLDTGEIQWGTPAIPFDAWTIACLIGPAENCPVPTGPDFDISVGPMVIETDGGRELVGAGQKSGTFWAHDPDDGEVVWSTQVGPGGLAGGLMWGAATDGRRVYVNEANFHGEVWNLVNPPPDSPASTTGGGWAALDADTGALLWQTADPLGAIAWSPVAANRNGLLFTCSMDDDGHLRVLDARNGRRLWEHPSGGACVAGAAVAGSDVYWGSGYIGPGGVGTLNNQFYAFRLTGGDDDDSDSDTDSDDG